MPADLTPGFLCKRGIHDWGTPRRVMFKDVTAGEDAEPVVISAHRCVVCKLYRLPVPGE